MSKLHQIIAVVSDRKKVWTEVLATVNKLVQKAEPFSGFSRTFVPFTESETPDKRIPPPESKKVVNTVAKEIQSLRDPFVNCFDAVLTQDVGNMLAKADVEIEGLSLKDIPATNLLYMERELTNFATLVANLPVLEAGETWTATAGGEYVSEAALTQKAIKDQVSLVLLQPTQYHPGQAQMITKDVPICNIHHIKFSGAISASRKETIAKRVATLLEAVKVARTIANSVDVKQRKEGAKVFDFLFAD